VKDEAEDDREADQDEQGDRQLAGDVAAADVREVRREAGA
jgi:hypothetical protein